MHTRGTSTGTMMAALLALYLLGAAPLALACEVLMTGRSCVARACMQGRAEPNGSGARALKGKSAPHPDVPGAGIVVAAAASVPRSYPPPLLRAFPGQPSSLVAKFVLLIL